MDFSSVRTQAFPPLREVDLGGAAFDYFTAHPAAESAAVVDAGRRPVGLLTRSTFLARYSGQYARALYENRPLSTMLEPLDRCVRRTDDVKAAVERLVGPDHAEIAGGLIVVDEADRYVGVASGMSVMQALLVVNRELVEDLEREITERKQIEARVRRLAESDPLTGLVNRRRFIEICDEWIAQDRRFGVGFVDLDRFKQLNDQYGHAVGDEVLKTIAGRIANVREGVVAARLGGDEFGLLRPLCADKATLAPQLAEVHDIVCRPVPTDRGDVSVGASIGAAIFPEDADNQAALLHFADKAMLRIKANGGGTGFFDPELDGGDVGQAELEGALRAAIKLRRIAPAYQPIYDLRSGRVIGHEALARWPNSGFSNDPQPSTFIPAAESLGLIDDMFWGLTEQVLGAHRTGGLTAKIAVNVSPSQFQSRHFVTRLLSILERHQIPPRQLELEVTETAMFRDMARSAALLNELAETGVSIALDDFGTGYSSLSLVKDLPLSKLKIDRSFVGNLSDASDCTKIVEATIGLCRALDIVCCAEGVETSETLQRLSELGCHQAQGFLLGRPDFALTPPARPASIARAG